MARSGSDVLDLEADDDESVRFTENLVGSTFDAGGRGSHVHADQRLNARAPPESLGA